MRVLVANRGEIARRIIETVHRLGHESVAVYAEPDAEAPHLDEADIAICIGPADLKASYLNVDALLQAMATTGADAVHPGYGFLAENAGFARAVQEAGHIWIGPSPDAIESMGSKIEARRLATAAGVATIPGFDASQADHALAEAAEEIGYPVLIKASAGGGGTGIRVARDAATFDDALSAARNEADRAFGDDKVIVEKYVERARHIEVQIIGDTHGNVLHLGTRECSVQRRYQKVLEEAPAPNLTDDVRHGLTKAAVALAAGNGYDSAGTVEFVLDDDTGEFYFLEMNTRLQVEHPVTEAVTGLDLVELMIGSAAGAPLPIDQTDVAIDGHSFECRINAEDVGNDFAPQTGTVSFLRVPDEVRWDSGIEEGSTITPFYDATIAKLIVSGVDRADALDRLRSALSALRVGGLHNNVGFHRWLVGLDEFEAGRITTTFLETAEIPAAPAIDDGLEPAAAALATRSPAAPWSALGAFSLTPRPRVAHRFFTDPQGELHEVTPSTGFFGDIDVIDSHTVAVTQDGHTRVLTVTPREEAWSPSEAAGKGDSTQVVAPFPALVVEAPVGVGDEVAAGDVVMVIEAMKMLHSLTAPRAAVIAEIRAELNQQVASGDVLVTFEQPGTE